MFSFAHEVDTDALDLDRLVLVEEHPIWTGCLLFRTADFADFYRRYSGWISRHQVLSELFSLGSFVTRLEEDGWSVVFGQSAWPVVERYKALSAPLTIEGYELHAFQQFAIRQALQRAREGRNAADRLFFWNWCAGAGKSYVCGAAAKLLFNSGDIDLVIATSTAKSKTQLCRFIQRAGVDVVINDPTSKNARKAGYFTDHQGFVMNIEKLRTDTDELVTLTAGKRVLFILDEAHHLISEAGHNQARKALDKITKGCEATVWPMSATVVDGNPLRYRDVFALDGYPRRNPLGTKEDFADRYATSAKSIPIKAKNGARFSLMKYEWDKPELHDVRHRVFGRTMAVRKSDDALKDTFQGMSCYPVTVPLSDSLRRVVNLILDDADRLRQEAREAKRKGGEYVSPNLGPHYLLLRMVLCAPGSIRFSGSELAAKILQENPWLTSVTPENNKADILNDMLTSIRESSDKAVVFLHWNSMGIHQLSPHLSVPHLLHHGDLTDSEADAVIQRFKDDPDITALFTTDAGAEGLNLQCARYVISVDPVYSYDRLYQRNSRIDRSDSHLSGLTAYVMVTEGTVEERIWGVCDDRRLLAAAVQGTEESLTYEGRSNQSETANREWLLFGDEEGPRA